jgi:hypothetical protein
MNHLSDKWTIEQRKSLNGEILLDMRLTGLIHGKNGNSATVTVEWNSTTLPVEINLSLTPGGIQCCC